MVNGRCCKIQPVRDEDVIRVRHAEQHEEDGDGGKQEYRLRVRFPVEGGILHKKYRHRTKKRIHRLDGAVTHELTRQLELRPQTLYVAKHLGTGFVKGPRVVLT